MGKENLKSSKAGLIIIYYFNDRRPKVLPVRSRVTQFTKKPNNCVPMQLNWTNAKALVWHFFFLVFAFLAFRIEGQEEHTNTGFFLGDIWLWLGVRLVLVGGR